MYSFSFVSDARFPSALRIAAALVLAACASAASVVFASDGPISEATQECISCHQSTHPGIVADWKRSRHAGTTPGKALDKPVKERRVSAAKVPENLTAAAVGCAECHSMNPDSHKDAFEHNGRKVHLTVSPRDCATCHAEESGQFRENIMSRARTNLLNNGLYRSLMKSVNGPQKLENMKIVTGEPDAQANADSCLHCHGTELEVKGKETRETPQGEMEFPVVSGWPNQGVGRLNPDGTNGSCTACHSRHEFSISMARKPYTCSQCHKGPDVTAYKVYSVSKHGNLFEALKGDWNFKASPWTIGQDFRAPTCAACHVSKLATPEGETVAERTHRMSDRLPWRILGLIYAHPHPKSPDTSIIRNRDGQPLPTTLDGQDASTFLISPEEMAKRRDAMQKICLSCHGADWVKGHWERFETVIKSANDMTRVATDIVARAWKEKAADDKESLFDEAIEKQWVEQWLFYANSTRYASAMMGADYGVFDNGRWQMSKNIQDMLDRLKLLLDKPERKR